MAGAIFYRVTNKWIMVDFRMSIEPRTSTFTANRVWWINKENCVFISMAIFSHYFKCIAMHKFKTFGNEFDIRHAFGDSQIPT